jgi:RNA polymerase sigma factor for flagellar operon FliA
MTKVPLDGPADMWRRFTRHADRQAREQLILHYAPLVKYVVGRLTFKLPRSLENEDLLGYGLIGLIEAVDRFNPERGVKFETFAACRIRGQIIDTLRSLDLLPRSARHHTKEIEDAIGVLCQSLGRLPEDTETAEYLHVSVDTCHDWLRDAGWAVVSLDQPVIADDGEIYTLHDSLEDTTVPSLSEQLDGHELKQQVIAAILALPEREQLMISLYYSDGLTMKEIGEVLGVSESRVSQMHAKAVLALRALMRSKQDADSLMYRRRHANAPAYAAIP